MLNQFRTASRHWLFRVFLIALAASFAVWGIGDIFRGRNSTVVAEVGGVEVTPQELDRIYQGEIQRARQIFGPTFDQNMARSMGLLERSVGMAVGDAMIRAETARLGLGVTDDMIARSITEAPAFRGMGGRFDRMVYEQVLARNGYTPATYEASLADDLRRQQLISALATPVPAPEPLVTLEHMFQGEQRRLITVRVPADPAAIEAPSDEALASYYDANRSAYAIPERRAVSFATLTPEALASEITVDEAALREAYEAHLDRYTTPATRQVLQMTFPDEAAAKAARDRIAAGESFDEVAGALGFDASTIDLGDVTREQMLPELADAAFALGEGAVSAPVQSPLGWHVLTARNIVEGKTQSFDDVRRGLEEELKLERALDKVYEEATQIEDSIAGGATIEQVAQQFGLELVKIDAIAADGTDGLGHPVARAPETDRFPALAFSTDQGATTPLTEWENGRYFILRVDGITQPEDRPLDEVRERVVADWRAEEARKQASERAEKLVEAVKGGTALAAAAAGFGLDVETPPAIDRRGQIAGAPGAQPQRANLPAPLVRDAFAAKTGDAVAADTGDGSRIVAVVADVIVPKAPEGAEAAALGARLEQAQSQSILTQYEKVLRARHPASINQGLINQMYPAAGS
nr:SurA N-terminal domain-containing protein [uncultured Tistrella sp.]